MSHTKVSIIIPTLNEEKHLPILLNAIKSQLYKEYEVIVADSDSKDKTRTIAIDYGFKVVDGGNISIGRNNGAKNAIGDILCFMDADIFFTSNFLLDSLNQMEAGGYDSCVPIFNSKGQKLKSRLLYWISDTTKRVSLNGKNKFATCQCLFIYKSSFELTGGFDERLSIGEDIDFMQKISKLNISFGLLNTRIMASDRRFTQIGIARVVIASLFFTILLPIGFRNLDRVQRLVTRLYGGWGKY